MSAQIPSQQAPDSPVVDVVGQELLVDASPFTLLRLHGADCSSPTNS